MPPIGVGSGSLQLPWQWTLSEGPLYIFINAGFVSRERNVSARITVAIATKASVSVCHFGELWVCHYILSLSHGISRGRYLQPNPKQVRMGRRCAPCQGCYHQQLQAPTLTRYCTGLILMEFLRNHIRS